MDINNYLVLINDQDKTEDIKNLKEKDTKIEIEFYGSPKIYSYIINKVKIYKEPKVIDHNNCMVYVGDRKLFNITKILDFQSRVRVFFSGGKSNSYDKSKLHFDYSVLEDAKAKDILTYLGNIATNLKGDDNDFLLKQYEKMSFVSDESVLAQYLKPKELKSTTLNNTVIYPFGLNLSQERAVSNALKNQISIIEGPPGTGKTQTILNILANLIVNDKTVAVVSNNNTAISNVFDKLDAQNLSFFAAILGNKDNQKSFFENQQALYPKQDALTSIDEKEPSGQLNQNMHKLKNVLESKNQLANASQELDELLIEQKYFMKLYDKKDNHIEEVEKISSFPLEKILSLWSELEYLRRENRKIGLFFKIRVAFKYKLYNMSLYKHSLDDIIDFLQYNFYLIKKNEIETRISELKSILEDADYDSILNHHIKMSMDMFQTYLQNRYPPGKHRKQFESDVLWKDSKKFTQEYPVVLSTTHSLRNSTENNFLYDYLIIDEASQVDIVAGALALSCAKNAVIVGDLKQLSHIIKQDMLPVINDTFSKYKLPPSYHYQNNLLLSVSELFSEAPKTLLREHYRCHPKIIDFCNKKFYDNELIILSKLEGVSSPLCLYNTSEGNHARGTYNQRQIDVIKEEILPTMHFMDIGIISPFRKQVMKLTEDVDRDEIEIDTVHKYQGREKDVVILTTVVDNENEFADDPNLLNVAISRAKKKLCVVVSDDEKNKNMKDLVNYIKYNNFDVVQSKIYSIFDLLYKNYAPHLNTQLVKLKNVSEFKSENLMNIVVEDVLNKREYRHLNYIMHYPLNKLIKDLSILDEKEKDFVQHPSTHLDILLYSKIDKRAVLAIEVDGFAFHENNAAQLQRDKLKDSILHKYNIPIIRFPTNGSQEEKKLIKKLQEVLGD